MEPSDEKPLTAIEIAGKGYKYYIEIIMEGDPIFNVPDAKCHHRHENFELPYATDRLIK
jgi:hypothetical protein